MIKSVKERFPNWTPPKLVHGKPNKYGWIVFYPENIVLGKYTDIGYGTIINAKYGIEIGEETQIGPYCCIYSYNTINGTEGKVVIEKYARIGAYSLILPNAYIPKDAFIKAKSIIIGR
jgi:acetyltransferase-like isoleucine patch superfamily enzyme